MTYGAAWGVLVLRLALGIVFVMHAYEQLVLFGPRDVAATILRQGFPASVVPLIAWYTMGAQALGGALLAVGLWTRVAAVLAMPTLFGAFFLLHLPQGFFMRGAIREAGERAAAVGYELSFLVLACTIAVALVGPGPFSIDDRRRAPGRRR
ncbi:MAG: DoxX family protein [Candidatus Rokubacteria bacterium]|nr:DoxX family protein [Candidatus Rokubacteria bacterium]